MPSLLEAIDVFAFPSEFETFGLVLAEAMAMGKPVVSYAVGGTPEVVVDGETGFLVSQRDCAHVRRPSALARHTSG